MQTCLDQSSLYFLQSLSNAIPKRGVFSMGGTLNEGSHTLHLACTKGPSCALRIRKEPIWPCAKIGTRPPKKKMKKRNQLPKRVLSLKQANKATHSDSTGHQRKVTLFLTRTRAGFLLGLVFRRAGNIPVWQHSKHHLHHMDLGLPIRSDWVAVGSCWVYVRGAFGLDLHEGGSWGGLGLI